MLPKKAKSQGFDLPVRPLGEKEDSIVWVFVRSTPLPLHKSHFKEAPITKTKTKRQKDKTIQRQNNSRGKDHQERGGV